MIKTNENPYPVPRVRPVRRRRPMDNFVYTGSVRTCGECDAVGGHMSWCDKNN